MKKFTFLLLLLSSVLLINAQTTWYTLASGDWDDDSIWTLDPAGAVPVNPLGEYPDDVNDNVVILTGKTVTIPDGVNPYDSPLRDLSLTCGNVTIYGQLDLRTSGGHNFSSLSGNGRLLMKGDNYPTITDDSDFITSGEGQGTVVLYGSDFSLATAHTFYNLEIDMTTGQTVIMDEDYTLNGHLLIKEGILQINGASAVSRTFTVNGNVTIQNGGSMTVGGGDAFHWFNVYGDLTNGGSIDFSNSAQYSEATNGAVKLRFLGATDNTFVCEGTTTLYRLFLNKGIDKTYSLSVSATNSAYFSLYGPVTGATTDGADGTSGWERLPLVINNGTLVLGSNIVIDRLGENINGVAPNEFSIPETARLWVDGATVTTGMAGTSYQANHNGLSLYGQLKISSGSFTCPQYSQGISYYTPVTYSAVVEIEGGNLNIPQLVQVNGGATFVYRQSGGNLNVNSLSEIPSFPTLDIPEASSVFEMTGGSIIFSHANGYWDGDIKLGSTDGNYYITDGTIEIQTRSSDFKMNSTVPIYNLTISLGSGSNQVINANANGLNVLNDLTIGAGTTLNDGGNSLSIGGDFNIAGTFTQTGSLVFNGSQDGVINNTTGGTVSLPGLHIFKERHSTPGLYYTVSLTGTDNIEVDGTLKLSRGALDVIDFNAMVTDSIVIIDGDLTSSGSGGLELTGTSKQIIKGASNKEQNFGRLILNNGGSSPQIELASNVNATSVTFSQDQAFVLGGYNLTVSSNPTTSTSWGSSCMFQTNGVAGDGSLTIGFTVTSTNGTVATFPVGQSGKYSPAVVNASGASGSTPGYLTVIPVDSKHPTSDPGSSTLDYYWKVKQSGFDALTSNLQYVFTYYTSLAPSTEKKGSVLTGSTWTETGTNVRSGSVFTFPYASALGDDFALGKANDYNTVRSLYCVADNTWDDPTSWSLSSGGSPLNPGDNPPTAADFVIIEAGQTITIDASSAVASQVQIDGTLYVNSGTTGHAIDLIKGNGRLVYENNVNWYHTTDIISGDHTEFCNSPTAIIEYASTSGVGPHIIPSSPNIPYYPNLTISESTGQTQTTNSMDLIVNGDLVVESGTFFLDGNYSEYVYVGGDVNIDAGTLTYEPSGIRYMEVAGDVTFTGAGTFNATTGGAENNLYLKGNINVGSGTLDFGSAGKLFSVYFEGDENSTYTTGGNVADFYRVKTAKSAGLNVSFNSGFNLTGSTSGASKALSLISGGCYLNHTDIDITLNSATDGNDFQIPEGTALHVDNGATVRIAGSNTGILLGDSLIIDNGGSVLANDGVGNYIQYTSTGDSYLEISNGGILNVGGQLRRKTTSDEGILTFVQDGGEVTIGSESAPLDTRGMFEILGTGSSFTQAAGDTIFIERSNGSTTVPSLYFNPQTVSYGAGAGFVFDGTAVSSETFGVYASQAMNDLSIIGANDNQIKLLTLSPVIEGNLYIGATTTFNANGINITLKGDITVTGNGSYTAGNNTTYFEGASGQLITGNITFYDVIKQTTTNTLTVAAGSTISISHDLTISTGTFDTGDNDVSVGGDLSNSAIVLSSGSSRGIAMEGSAVQQISGNGTYDRLTINNSNGGVTLPTQSGAITFAEELNLEAGVFDIGRNLLVLEENASLNAVNPFSESNMIQTNLSFVDNGIEKYFPVIGSSTVFTYPIGSLGKYTPIVMDITANGNNTGSIRVKAADEPHISVPVNDQDQVLQYNWTLDADGITGFTADVLMYSYDNDAVGDTAAYITARILLGSTDWNKYTTDDFSGHADATDISRFTFSSTDDAGIDGDYTAGAAIPDQVPAYITMADGPWTTTTTWATYDPDTQVKGVAGENIPAGGPRGSIIYVDHVLTFPTNFMAAYRTNINATGTVSIGTTIGHRLGEITGTGLLKLNSGDAPAGTYDAFFSASGGVLEYSGSTDYDILSEITELNHLKLSGTGQRRFPNIDFQILGDLTIDGPAVINTHNRNMSIKGDVIFTSGTFDPGTTSGSLVPTVTMNGTSLQNISGTTNFTSYGGGNFYQFEIDNASGVSISMDSIEVNKTLILTDGAIYNDIGGTITVTNSLSGAVSGGSVSSYVQGPLRKVINNSDNFEFPLGDQSRYNPLEVSADASSGGIWEVQYYSHNPDTDGYSTSNMDGNVAYVSHTEYWRVKGPVSGSAKVTLNWDATSGVDPADTDFRMVEWTDLATDAWAEVSIDAPVGTSSSGYVQTSSDITFNEFGEGNCFTFGSISVPAYTWVGGTSVDWFTASNWSGSVVPSASSDVTIIAGSSYNAEINGVAQMNGLNISSGTLTVKSGSQVTINGNLTTNDALTIENTVASPASLIVNGTVSGNTTYQWSGNTTGTWWQMAHPVVGATQAEYDASFGVDRYAVNRYLATGWERVVGFHNVYGGGYALDAEPLEGYSVYTANAGVLTYSGVLKNAASYSLSGLDARWHLVANPYPSYIDVEDAGFDLGSFSETVYIRKSDEQVSTYNISSNVGLLEGSRYIAPGQSIWLRTYTSNDAISISKTTCTHSSGGYGLKSASTPGSNDILRLSVNSASSKDESVVIFNSNGSEFVTLYDSEKLMNGGAIPNIYTLKEGKNIAINSLPELTSVQTVPLGIKVTEEGMTEYTITADNIMSFMPEADVYLEDKTEGITVDLRETPEYSFAAEGLNNRFELRFEKISTDITSDHVSVDKGDVIIFSVGNKAHIKVTNDLLQNPDRIIELYDVKGQFINRFEMETQETIFNLPKSKTVYVIKVTIGSSQYQEKIIGF